MQAASSDTTMTSRFEVTDRTHCKTLLSRLNEQRAQGTFCDVTIVVQESKFKAHRNVLAAFSLYFKEVLCCRNPCPLQPVLELQEVKADVFAKILSFMYSSRLVVEKVDEACELAAAGSWLGIPFLEELAPRAREEGDPDYPRPAPPAAGPREEPGLGDGALPWPIDRPYACRASLTPSFPIDLTSASSRPQAEEDRPLPGLELRASPVLGGEEEMGGENTAEAGQRLYTLSTVAFRGLGFSVEEGAGPGGGAGPPQEEEEEAGEEGEGEGGATSSKDSSPSPQLAPPRDPASPLNLHLRLQRDSKALSCPHCHKAFVHVKRLQTHQMLCRRVGRTAGHRAEERGGTRGPGQALKLRRQGRPDPVTEEEHFMKVVDGHLLYFCATCQRSYMTLSSLKRHANVHSWRRRYPCRYCDKVFALAEYRTKHEVWHTGERRYQCIFCWDTFVTYYNLKTHQKSFHGVDPGLTISQKTPNGGYKPKLNAFKLYRLLPMRSQKRPYKTYSHSGPGSMAKPGSDVPGADTSPTGLPREESGQGSRSPPPEPCPEPESARSASGAPGCGPLSSVITYGRTAKSSVIVHGKALASVIAYNGRCSRQEGPAASDSPGPAPTPCPPTPLTPHSPVAMTTSDQRQEQRQEPRPQKPKKQPASHKAKTLTYVAKPACAGVASGSRPGPLCQITVRIGEEAIVKRRISESDLIRDKAGPALGLGSGLGKGRRPEALPLAQGAKKARAEEGERGCPRRPEYLLGAESADEVSDQDADDNLWRPYYSYKPKRRGAGFHRAKRSSWRRKLGLRPPGRWLHRAAKDPEPGGEDLDLLPRGQEPSPEAGLHTEGPSREAEGALDRPACGGSSNALGNCGDVQLACDKAPVSPACSPSPQALGRGQPATGRKAPGWHTCAHCPKSCKTAAALGRHRRRHLAEDGPGLAQASGLPATSSPEPPRTPSRKAETRLEGALVESAGLYRHGPGKEVGPRGLAPGWELSAEQGRQMAVCGGEGRGPPGERPPGLGPDPRHSPSPPRQIPGSQACSGAAGQETRVSYADGGTPEPRPVPRAGSPGPSSLANPAQAPGPETGPPRPPDPLLASPSREAGTAEGGLDFRVMEPVAVVHEVAGGFEGPERTPPPITDTAYPVQEYPVPLVMASSCRSLPESRHKGLDFHPGALRYKEGEEDLGKVAFYQDPYQLVYGHPLLANSYPYAFGPVSTLPVALNMVIQDKGQQLPLLHRMFVYPTPCRDESHPLPPPPPLGAGGTGSRDEAGRELLAADKGRRMY